MVLSANRPLPDSGISSDSGMDRTLHVVNSELDLFRHRDEDRARAKLVERYDPLARRLARRFAGRGTDRDDLVQIARFGLLNAIDRFDPDLGYEFKTFATRTIVGEIKHHFRGAAWAIRVPRSLQNLWLETSKAMEALTQELGHIATVSEIAERVGETTERVLEAMDAGSGFSGVSLDRPVGDDGITTIVDLMGEPDMSIETAPDRIGLAKAMRTLDERERSILYMRFFEGRTQEEMASVLGISQVHVSRLLHHALGRLAIHTQHQAW